MDRLDQKQREEILALLCEGNSQRGIERAIHVQQNTIAKLLADAGDMAIAFVAGEFEDPTGRRLQNLKVRNIQADELHAFIGVKDKNIDESDEPSEDAGTSWCYLAMCTETKLIFEYALGSRDLPDATDFMKRVASKLKRKKPDTEPDGEFEVRPTVATDGLKAYEGAFSTAFGANADYGMLVKLYEKGAGGRVRGRYIGADRRRKSGHPAEKDIHTCYIERQNLNLRMGNRRFTRRSNAFSKTRLNHERHLALWILYHNYVLIPRPVRPPVDANGETMRDENGKKLPWTKRLPPAMAAGMTDKLWSVRDLLALTDSFIAHRRVEKRQAKKDARAARLRALAAKPSTEILRAAFWVYRSFVHHTTKVHRTGCANCRDGHGKKGGGGTKSGEWLPFDLLNSAKEAAALLCPDDTSICNMCLGEYRWLGYHGSRQAL